MSQTTIRQKIFSSLHTTISEEVGKFWQVFIMINFGTYFFIEQPIRKNRKNSREGSSKVNLFHIYNIFYIKIKY